jgi:AraC-like DNA-binding protein
MLRCNQKGGVRHCILIASCTLVNMKIFAMGIENKYNGNFRIERTNWTRDYLFLHVRTSAIFVLHGREVLAPPNSVILYHVNTPQLYYAKEENYSDDFIHFLVEDDYNFFHALNFSFNTIIELQNAKTINELLKQIYLEYISNNTQKYITVDLLLKLLFTKISEQTISTGIRNSDNECFDLLSKLRTDIYLHPDRDWSVHEMAKYTNLSMSYIQYLFKQTFGVPCINAVIHSRMERAKALLTTSDISIKEVAGRCGYQNDIAFMRQFKKNTGSTPSEFRVGNSKSENNN